MMQPLFEISASSTILNGRIYFPAKRIVQSSQPIINGHEQIAPLSKFSFPEFGLTLLFQDNTLTFFTNSGLPDAVPFHLISAVWYFISFKTYMYYNVQSLPNPDVQIILNSAPEVDCVSFNLGRVPSKDELQQSLDLDVVPIKLDLMKSDVLEYIRIVDTDIHLAISYYLIGCENMRYFLIEHYKSLEVIKNFFRSKSKMSNSLSKFGFRPQDYDKLCKLANGELQPLNIGRHAPKKGIKLVSLNIKQLLDEPKSREIFEESTRICRSAIESFINFRRAGKDNLSTA